MGSEAAQTVGDLYQQAIRAYRGGELREAERLVREIIARDNSHAGAAHLLAVIGLQTGHADEALQLLLHAVALDPGFIEAWLTLGLTYRRAGKIGNAAKAFERILTVDPDNATALYLLGLVRHRQGRAEAALGHYRRTLELEPANAEAMASLAELLERRGRLEEARSWAERALQAAAGNVGALLLLTQLDLREGRLTEAVTRLEGLSAQPLSPRNASLALGRLAAAYDKLGRFEDAWSTATRSNETLLGFYRYPLPGDDNLYSLASVARLKTHFAQADPSRWSPYSPPAGARRPVFLVGFPRSGTTLLDQVLSSHPALYALEEQETLRDVYQEFAASETGLERLGSLGAADIERLRERYWQRVEEILPAEASGRTLIDKLPLNSLLIGVIHRFFPDARYVFAIRDPRDVCLSCYLQTFRIEGAMGYFLRLEHTVDYYTAVMDLALSYLERLPLTVHRIRYEELVHRFDAQILALLEFLGVGWSDEVRRFHETAGRRSISTPSYSQVTQPLYESSVGRWRSYARQLEPVLHRLAPFIERLGYPSD